MKELIIVCGVSSSGKTTFANKMRSKTGGVVYEADQFFYDENGNYNWYPSGLAKAHKQCKNNCENAMKNNVEFIYVSNTFTRRKDINPYLKLADKYGYTYTVIAVGNYHNNNNNHGVDDSTKERMRTQIRESFNF